MLVESGLLYSMIKVAELILYSMSSPSFYIVFYSMAQIMCITYVLSSRQPQRLS